MSGSSVCSGPDMFRQNSGFECQSRSALGHGRGLLYPGALCL